MVVGCDEPENDEAGWYVWIVWVYLTSVEFDSENFDGAAVTGNEEASECM